MLLCSFRSATHVALLPVPLLMTLCFGDKSACPTGCGHCLALLGTLWTLLVAKMDVSFVGGGRPDD